MAAASKIISSLSSDAIRWVESLANKLSGKPEDYVRFPTTPENVAYETGEKLVNLDRFAPQMFDIYDDRALYYALKEAQEGSADVGLIKPDTFRRAAAEIPMTDPYIRDMVAQKVSDLRDLRQAGIRGKRVVHRLHTAVVLVVADAVRASHRVRRLHAQFGFHRRNEHLEAIQIQ